MTYVWTNQSLRSSFASVPNPFNFHCITVHSYHYVLFSLYPDKFPFHFTFCPSLLHYKSIHPPYRTLLLNNQPLKWRLAFKHLRITAEVWFDRDYRVEPKRMRIQPEHIIVCFFDWIVTNWNSINLILCKVKINENKHIHILFHVIAGLNHILHHSICCSLQIIIANSKVW